MYYKKLQWIFFCSWLGSFITFRGGAQSDLPLVRSWTSSTVLALANAESYRPDGSFFYAQMQQAFNQPAFLATAGYEQHLWRRWFAGLALTYNANNQLHYAINLNHSGKFLHWQFLKQVSYTFQSQPKQQDETHAVQFLAGIARNFKLKSHQHFLRTVLSYQAIIFPSSSTYQRTIDQTRLQVEAAYFLKEHFSIGFFLAQSTRYYIALARYDANGNLIAPDRRLNLNTALVGARLHLLLNLDQVVDKTHMRILAY